MTRFTVLITCVGGDFGPELVHNFRACDRYDVRVIGVDQNARTPSRYHCDAFFEVPKGASPDYVDCIAGVVENYNVDFVLPTSDDEALSLSKMRHRFERTGCRLACTSHDVLSILSDKFATHKHLQKLGFYTPDLRCVTELPSLSVTVSEMLDQYDSIVVKPTIARGARGVIVIGKDIRGVKRYPDRREIHSSLHDFSKTFLEEFKSQFPVIVMERLLEPVYDLDMLAWEGDPIRIVPRRRVNSAVPNDGHTIVGNKELIELGERLIEGFNLSWLYDCDVMYHASGAPCVLEINPRPSGSLVVSIAAGIPFVEDLISLAKGEKPDKVVLPLNTQVIPYKSLFRVPSS